MAYFVAVSGLPRQRGDERDKTGNACHVALCDSTRIGTDRALRGVAAASIWRAPGRIRAARRQPRRTAFWIFLNLRRRALSFAAAAQTTAGRFSATILKFRFTSAPPTWARCLEPLLGLLGPRPLSGPRP